MATEANGVECQSIELAGRTIPLQGPGVTNTLDEIRDFQGFAGGYIECALWSETYDTVEDRYCPIDSNFGIVDIDEESLKEMVEDCRQFWCKHRLLLSEAWGKKTADGEAYEYPSAGHDLWLTRNGHGAGFWDRGLGTLGDALTDNSHELGRTHLYVQDGKVSYERG